MVDSRPLGAFVINLVRSIRQVTTKGRAVTEPQFDAPPDAPVQDAPDAPVEPATDQPSDATMKRGRGRPRARETLERDQVVLDVLRDNGPMTREQLADALNVKASLVYLALWRLARQEPPKVVRVADGAVRHAWQLA